jgi:cytochrome c2
LEAEKVCGRAVEVFDFHAAASHFLFLNQPGEVFKGTVVGFFGVRREKTARQLAT